MKLSIIVPIYNTEKYLKRCLDSLLNQSYKDFELILVNDGSTDNSFFICENYKKKDRRIKVIHKKNGGLVSARKAGLKLSKGEYIGYFDSDDYVGPNQYEKFMNYADGEVDIVCGSYIWQSDNYYYQVNNPIDNKLYEKSDIDFLKKKCFYSGEFYKNNIIPSLCCKIFRREFIYYYQMRIDDNIVEGEDVCLTFTSIYSAKKIVVDNNINSYHYYQNPNSISHSYNIKYADEIANLSRCMKENYIKEKKKWIIPQLDFLLAYLIIKSVEISISNNKKHFFKQAKFLKTMYESSNIYKNGTFDTIDGIYRELPYYERMVVSSVVEKKFVLTIFYRYLKMLKSKITSFLKNN